MTDRTVPQAFDFQADAEQLVPAGAPAVSDSPPSADEVMAAAGVAAYRWQIGGDSLAWSANAGEVLGCDPGQVASGKAFALRLDPDNVTSRYDAVMRASHSDNGQGVPYEIEYAFCPDGRLSANSIWLADCGRWFAGPDGRPARALGTVRRIANRQAREQQLAEIGSCDPLTGMMNRGRMVEALGEAIAVAARNNGSCGVVLAAINNLGVVNEAFGFEIADEVIVSLGRRLRQVVRSGDAIARFSGSKFGIILNTCDEEALDAAIHRFLNMARESVIETQKGPVWALLSIGALTLPMQAGDAVTALARAEEALTEARKLPSDGYVIYRPSHDRDRQRRTNARNASEIVKCLREDRFLLAYQPVVAASGGPPVFHEALLRMRDQRGQIVHAAELIPIAEKLGLVRLIDRAVVQKAIAALIQNPEARLSINISGTTATDPRWSPQITNLLAANPEVTGRMIIEITETMALSDIEASRSFAQHLRELGCSVAIDDFGAGFTSFRNLRQLPVDILKIDGQFCRGLADNPDNCYFARALIDLARAFDFRTVAEWVENESDATLLRQWGVDYLQGNLFGSASLDPPWPPPGAGHLETDALPDDVGSEIGWLSPGEGSQPMAIIAEEPARDESEAGAGEQARPDTQLDSELDRLRAAISALDAAFRRNAEADDDEPRAAAS